MKRKFILALTMAGFLALSSSLNGPANAQIGIGGRNALSNPVVSGVLSLADGTLALPSLTNTGNTNTGLFFPSADTVAFSAGGKDLGEWHVVTGTLTATQVRKLNATPVEIVPTAGSGKGVIVHSVQWMMDYGGTPFDASAADEDLRIQYTTSNSIILADCDHLNCINAAAANDTFGYQFGQINALSYNPDDNQGVEVTIRNGEWASTDDDTDGNSVLHYLVRYRVVTLDLS